MKAFKKSIICSPNNIFCQLIIFAVVVEDVRLAIKEQL